MKKMIIAATALVALFAEVKSAHASYCSSLFDSHLPNDSVQVRQFGPAANGKMARGRNVHTAVLQMAGGFTAKIELDGFFSVYKAAGPYRAETFYFNSKPSIFREMNLFDRHYSSNSMLSMPDAFVPQVLVKDRDAHYLLHARGDLTKLDIWEVPFLTLPRELDLHELLFSFPRKSVTRNNNWGEIGFAPARDEQGLYSGTDMKSLGVNVGATAFITSMKTPGTVYAMYEILSGWTRFLEDGPGARGPYARQQITLVKIDLQTGTAQNLGTYFGARPNRLAPGDGQLAEDLRYTEFSLLMDEYETKVRVIGHSLGLGKTTILLEEKVPGSF